MAGVARARSPGVHLHKNNGRGCPSFMGTAPIHFNPSDSLVPEKYERTWERGSSER